MELRPAPEPAQASQAAQASSSQAESKEKRDVFKQLLSSAVRVPSGGLKAGAAGSFCTVYPATRAAIPKGKDKAMPNGNDMAAAAKKASLGSFVGLGG